MTQILLIIALVALAVLSLRVEAIGRRRRIAARQPQPLVSDCACGHGKSFHTDGKGHCQKLDLTMKYVEQAGHPPCRCCVYMPKQQAAIPPPAPPEPGQYSPEYTAFLEWWNDHYDPSEGKLRR